MKSKVTIKNLEQATTFGGEVFAWFFTKTDGAIHSEWRNNFERFCKDVKQQAEKDYPGIGAHWNSRLMIQNAVQRICSNPMSREKFNLFRMSNPWVYRGAYETASRESGKAHQNFNFYALLGHTVEKLRDNYPVEDISIEEVVNEVNEFLANGKTFGQVKVNFVHEINAEQVKNELWEEIKRKAVKIAHCQKVEQVAEVV